MSVGLQWTGDNLLRLDQWEASVVIFLTNQGTQFQLLVGPAFIYTFASAALVFGLLLDRFNRPLLTGIG